MTVLVFCCIEHTVVTDCSKMAAVFAVRNSALGYLAFIMYMVMPTPRGRVGSLLLGGKKYFGALTICAVD